MPVPPDAAWYASALGELAEWIRRESPSVRAIARRAGCSRHRAVALRDRAYALEDRRGQVEDTTDGVDRTLLARGGRIQTLPQLLDAAEVDLEQWAVSSWKANAWEQNSAAEGLVTLRQVKATLERRALPVRPARTRLADPVPVSRPARPGRSGTLVLCVPDTQHGIRWLDTRYQRAITTHDPAAIDLALQVAADLQPDRIVLGGDHVDAAAVGRYRKDASVRQTMQPTIDLLGYDLARLRAACPNAVIDWLDGNHDQRLADHLVDEVPEAADLRPANTATPAMSLANLLHFAALGIQRHGPYGGPEEQMWLHQDVDPVALRHAGKLRQDGLSSAAANLAAANHHLVCFHEHRRYIAWKTVHGPRGPREVGNLNPGALVRLGGVVPGVHPRENWQQGLGLVWLEDDGAHLELIAIRNGRARYGDRVWFGNPSLDEVADATEWGQLVAA